jgi:hypothetical protein
VSILQDVGHAPFSESLGRIFQGAWVGSLFHVPLDKARTVTILQYLEEREQLLSKLGLSLEVLVRLVLGDFPWPAHAWAKRLIDGVLDADRLAYVEQDLALTKGVGVSAIVNRVARGLEEDGPGGLTIVDSSASEDTLAFVKNRGSLYTDVYNHPVKLALDYLMRDVLQCAWNVGTDWLDPHLRRPETVEDFLTWTDNTVDRCVDERDQDLLLKDLHRLLRNGKLMVAEVTELGGGSLSFAEIDAMLESLEVKTFPDEFVWVVRSKDIGQVSIYEPGSIVVGDRDSFRPLENVHRSLSELAVPLRRRALVIAESGKLDIIIKKLLESRLTLQQIQFIGKIWTGVT